MKKDVYYHCSLYSFYPLPRWNGEKRRLVSNFLPRVGGRKELENQSPFLFLSAGLDTIQCATYPLQVIEHKEPPQQFGVMCMTSKSNAQSPLQVFQFPRKAGSATSRETVALTSLGGLCPRSQFPACPVTLTNQEEK